MRCMEPGWRKRFAMPAWRRPLPWSSGSPGAQMRTSWPPAVKGGSTIVTENVADFARLSAEHLLSGQHHSGVLIALSSRFSRRPSGRGVLSAAIAAIANDELDDRVVYLSHAPRSSVGQ